MPAIDRIGVLQLGILLLAVPVQFFVVRIINPTSESERILALRQILNKFVSFRDSIFNWESVQSWCSYIFNRLNLRDTDQFSHEDVQKDSSKNNVESDGYFASSRSPRFPRSPNVMFRVGQVVRHKRWGYRGVIFGWDETARAPKAFFDRFHTSEHPDWRNQPNYSILVDTRDRLTPQMTYVPQENIEVITSTRVIHPSLDDFFEGFNGLQYLPRPFLRNIYPHD